ncbi:hypothetical protein UFOVP1608_23 [uncultured Caudovirales phage]|uniref:Tail protein n=1 Tax=uncultured Caudovirales phage TaxID=2100421 RepID=A0A6J5SS46_9CAUD|nr:hypothetical protein UFOVP1608_23 [uncultured Caudovirales phage]
MGLQAAIAQVGIAKQSVKGTPIANPTHGHGVLSGTIMTADIQQGLEDHTSSTRVSSGVNRTGVICGMDLTARAHSKSVGLWLYAALGGYSVSGAGPYTHVITSGSDLPYLTAFGKMGSNIYAVNDLKLDSMDISWTENEPLEIAVSGIGTTPNLAATYVPVADDTLTSYFTAGIGTFTVDVDGGGATSATAKITAGSISIKNGTSAVMVSGSITPDDVFVGRQEVEVSFDVVPDDLLLWRTILTAASGGTTVSASPTYGTFSHVFTLGSDTLTLAASRVAFTTDNPDIDPAGGPVTITLAGLAVQPAAGGTPLTATLINTHVTY